MEDGMRQLGIGFGVALAAALGAVPATAGAGNLSGHYQGKASCVGIDGGAPARFKQQFDASSPVFVTDLGTGRVLLHLPGHPDFELFVQPVLGIPVQGFSALGGINCPLDLVGLQGGTLMATLKEKAGKVAIKALLIALDDAGGRTITCKLSLKRVDSVDPAVSGCN
jgi:hypothetical protein